uniref:G patch domain-containing protein 4 n=1 Tax=Salmo trutta TaxID=8032 RepID=A0A674CWZ9_SALTR
MAETVQERSRGLKFAKQQLLRHGWEQGKGLGRQENGICEAIIVNVQFTFHWWDHVFNKASSSLEVESGELSPQKGYKLYGCFVKVQINKSNWNTLPYLCQ